MTETSAEQDLHQQVESDSEANEDEMLPQEKVQGKHEVILKHDQLDASRPALVELHLLDGLCVIIKLGFKSEGECRHQHSFSNCLRSNALISAHALQQVLIAEFAKQHI